MINAIKLLKKRPSLKEFLLKKKNRIQRLGSMQQITNQNKNLLADINNMVLRSGTKKDTKSKKKNPSISKKKKLKKTTI